MGDQKDAVPNEPAWRGDFPVGWEDDHYVTRRELAKFLTLGSGLLVAANAGIALRGRLRSPEDFPAMPIARTSELAPGTSHRFRYPTDADPCILVRATDGKLLAYSQVCTHLACAVVYRRGRHDDDESLFCPCHNGSFSVSEGRPTAGPPTRPLPRILLETRGDEVWAVGVTLGARRGG